MQEGDISGAREVLLKMRDEEDIRAPAHGRWWLARAQLEGM